METIVDCHSHHISAPYNSEYLSWAERTGRRDYGPPYLWNDPLFEDAVGRIGVMDRYGIDYSVVTYSANIVQIIDCLMEGGRTRREAVGDLNEGMRRTVGEHPSRLGATALLDLRDVDSAVDEMEATADWALGYSVLTGYATDHGFRTIDDRSFDRFWKRAEGIGLPVFVHFSSLYRMGDEGDRLPGYMNQSMLHAGLGQLMENTLCLGRLVMGGTFDRHPSVRVVMGQLGGMYPMMTDRFDMLYHMHLDRASDSGTEVVDEDDPTVRMRDLADYRDNIYVDTHSMGAAAIGFAAQVLGPDRVLFGSDLPITPESWGMARGIEQVMSSPVPDGWKTMILSENAVELLGLDRFLRRD